MEDTSIIKVAFYVRVSTIEQSTKWYWPDYQLADFNKLIQYKSTQEPSWVTNKRWYYEDLWLTWSDLNRPWFQQMMKDAKNKEFDLVVVWKIDRLSRNLSHLLKAFEDLKSYWVWFYSIKENIDFTWPIWKLTFQLFWALAEFEREMIRTRTTEWKVASAKSWNYVESTAPYGYKKIQNPSWKGSKLSIIKEEAKIVKMVFEMFVYDNINYTNIAERLNDLKITKWKGWTRKGIEDTIWYETTVKDILTRTEYIWYRNRIFKKDNEVEEVTMITPKIISEYVFNIAQEKVKEIYDDKLGWTRKYLLSWKIYDSIELTDKGKMRKFIWVKRTKWGHSYRRDSFPNYEWVIIPNKEFPWKVLDDFVWGYIINFVNKPEDFFKLYKKQTTELNSIDSYREQIEFHNDKINEQNMLIENAEKSELLWRLSEEKKDKFVLEANKIISNSSKLIIELESKIEDILNIEFSREIINKASEDYLSKINDMTDDQKRMLVDILVDRVQVSEDSNWNMVIDVIFRFNANITDSDNSDIELTNTLNKTKNTSKGVIISEYGAPGRIRTHDL